MSQGDRASLAAAGFVVDPIFAADVQHGLAASPKSLPCRWFYDAKGSALFEEITQLVEYYPTRTEIGILKRHMGEIVAAAPKAAVLVEFGSGSSVKTELLLEAMSTVTSYAPIDVSSSALQLAGSRLSARFPRLLIEPICEDFTGPSRLPSSLPPGPRLGFFPGSTIGNFNLEDAERLLSQFLETLGAGSALLIGVDLRKSEDVLLPAYNDASGVTAAFNLNLLHRINAELGGTFDVEGFAHEAVWNDAASRIEMHIKSLRAQSASVAGAVYQFAEGERIHTENSYKHTAGGFREMASRAGWRSARHWTDEANYFGVFLLERSE